MSDHVRMSIWAGVAMPTLQTPLIPVAAAQGPALRVALDASVLCVTFPGKGQCKQKHLHKK